jgi:DNA-binding LacI/PurR family transcriptional regulator
MRLLDQRVWGVVLNASSVATTPPCHVSLLQDAGIPVVLLHRPIPGVSAPVLETPAEEIGQKAAESLVSAGHREIAFFDSYRDDMSARTEAGFRKALEVTGLELPESNVIYGQSSEWINKTSFDEYDRFLEHRLPTLLSQRKPPTAIFASFDTVAEHIYLAAQRFGVRIPEDLAVLSFGGAHRDGAILKRLSAITIDEVAAGRKAVDLIQEMRAGQRQIKDTETIHLPLSDVAGETLVSVVFE